MTEFEIAFQPVAKRWPGVTKFFLIRETHPSRITVDAIPEKLPEWLVLDVTEYRDGTVDVVRIKPE